MRIRSNRQPRLGPSVWFLALVSMCGMAGQRCLCWGCESNHGPCGDNHINDGEECDGTQLWGQTCEDEGYQGGELGCTELCELDTSRCWNSVCGDGVVDANEVCDGDTGLEETCNSLGYWGGGTLSCRVDCSGFVTVSCDQSQRCGNGVQEGEEACDGGDLGGESCVTLGYLGGTLACEDCSWLDDSGCAGVAQCGDGVTEGTEVCDGSDLRGAQCGDAGFSGGGTLGCQAQCQGWDVAHCVGGCGNGLREGAESCDGTDFDGLGCPDLGYPVGALVCRADCDGILVTGCGTWDATCGDGVIQPGEQCDATSFGRTDDCIARGYLGGSLACDPWCRVDTRGCQGDLCAYQGGYQDGWCDLCEHRGGTVDPDCAQLCPLADGVCVSKRDSGLGVSTCLYATGVEDPDCGICGDGVQLGAEVCDTTDLGLGCVLFGYQSGIPATCDATCIPDLSTCTPHACGDGILCPAWQPACHEECDDGNLLPGDGCDGSCLLEP